MLNYFAWERASEVYLAIFVLTVVGIVGIFFLGSYLVQWYHRRKMESEISAIEKKSGLTEEEADFIVHVINKNDLNVPLQMYSSLRVYDTLVGREIEMLMDSSAPFKIKESTIALSYSAREKLFPMSRQVVLPEVKGEVEKNREKAEEKVA